MELGLNAWQVGNHEAIDRFKQPDKTNMPSTTSDVNCALVARCSLAAERANVKQALDDLRGGVTVRSLVQHRIPRSPTRSNAGD
jgi:hypothetical protein